MVKVVRRLLEGREADGGGEDGHVDSIEQLPQFRQHLLPLGLLADHAALSSHAVGTVAATAEPKASQDGTAHGAAPRLVRQRGPIVVEILTVGWTSSSSCCCWWWAVEEGVRHGYRRGAGESFGRGAEGQTPAAAAAKTAGSVGCRRSHVMQGPGGISSPRGGEGWTGAAGAISGRRSGHTATAAEGPSRLDRPRGRQQGLGPVRRGSAAGSTTATVALVAGVVLRGASSHTAHATTTRRRRRG
mmetsp:Transcript_8174/g.22758  ORF Transcript_8174/g.22758 Transcript_8174/m.22758 type:complete len:244 (-) Transcript_8174:229-960(-)